MHVNNTYLLERLGWRGIMVEYDLSYLPLNKTPPLQPRTTRNRGQYRKEYSRRKKIFFLSNVKFLFQKNFCLGKSINAKNLWHLNECQIRIEKNALYSDLDYK